MAMFTHSSSDLSMNRPSEKDILVLSDKPGKTFSSLDRFSNLLTSPYFTFTLPISIFKSDAQLPQIGPITPVFLVLPSPNEIPFHSFPPHQPHPAYLPHFGFLI